MVLALVTPPTAEPISVEELRKFAAIDHADDDPLLSVLAVAAREFVEASSGLALASATWELTARAWPSCVITLPKPPLQSVESLKHRTASGAIVTLTADVDFIVDGAGGSVEPVTTWPPLGDYPDAVQLRFTAGFEGADAVPHRAKLAIMSLAAFWYETRTPAETSEGATRRVPFHVRTMLAQLRGGRLEVAS